MSAALAEPSVQKGSTPPAEWDREAFQKQVLEAFKSVGSVVRGNSIREVGDNLKLQEFSVRRIKSALWHLTRSGALPDNVAPGSYPSDDNFYIHCYRVTSG